MGNNSGESQITSSPSFDKQEANRQGHDWHDLPPALPDAKKGEPAMKHWFTSAVHPPPQPPWPGALCGNDTRLLPKTRGPHEYSCRPTLLEMQQNSLRSAPRNPRCARTHKYTCAVQYACVVLLLLSASLVFLWHPGSPRTPNCRNATHMHTHTHGLRYTYMLSCLRGLAGEYCAQPRFFPPPCGPLLSKSRHSLYHNSASAELGVG